MKIKTFFTFIHIVFLFFLQYLKGMIILKILQVALAASSLLESVKASSNLENNDVNPKPCVVVIGCGFAGLELCKSYNDLKFLEQ